MSKPPPWNNEAIIPNQPFNDHMNRYGISVYVLAKRTGIKEASLRRSLGRKRTNQGKLQNTVTVVTARENM